METELPPLGLIPKYLHDEMRLRDIYAAMQRYYDKKKIIPQEWIEEMLELQKYK